MPSHDWKVLTRMFTQMFGLYHLSATEQAGLLGLPTAENCLDRFRAGDVSDVDCGIENRVGQLLAIHRLLRILFSKKAAARGRPPPMTALSSDLSIVNIFVDERRCHRGSVVQRQLLRGSNWRCHALPTYEEKKCGRCRLAEARAEPSAP